jgi:hypothetical protein
MSRFRRHLAVWIMLLTACFIALVIAHAVGSYVKHYSPHTYVEETDAGSLKEAVALDIMRRALIANRLCESGYEIVSRASREMHEAWSDTWFVRNTEDHNKGVFLVKEQDKALWSVDVRLKDKVVIVAMSRSK